ncbi:protrudin-like isoform X1 [Saccostrea echinata]|uniref:protrudin-like isoform X1 n=2 Tax=Saccostrea echinata TaxID=191078 RepID=UPI002A8069BA|nr:protrudin-like isoform X1 [Saccostrea echinata]
MRNENRNIKNEMEMSEESQVPNGKRKSTENGSKYGRMDLADFVTEVETFSRLVEPIAFVVYCIEDIRKWKYTIGTLVVWILCNIGCLVLTKGAVFTLISLLVICIATTSLVQLHTRILDKCLPSTSSQKEEEDEDIEDEEAMKTVKQFRYSLLQMYDFIVLCNEGLTQFYRILKWDNTLASLRFHVEICVFLLSLVVLPTRGICFMLVNWFFLANEVVFYKLLKYGEKVWGVSLSPIPIKDNGAIRYTVLEEDQQKSKEEDTKEQPEVDCDPSQLEIMSDDSDLKSSIYSKPSMVERLLELRKRRQHIAHETCHKCDVSFASILKRRFYCRHCGNNFCSKCCNQKVPKSMFGATAPQAQTEMVLVCGVCYDLLMNQADKDKQS